MHFIFTGAKNIVGYTEGSVIPRFFTSMFYSAQSHTELLDFTRFQNYRQEKDENTWVVTRNNSLAEQINAGICGTKHEALALASCRRSVSWGAARKTVLLADLRAAPQPTERLEEATLA